MKRHDLQIIHSSEESDWRTPRPLYDALDREAYFSIDLAADEASALQDHYLGPGSPYGEDALVADWVEVTAAVGAIPIGFLNPPFSRKKARALKKAGDPAWRIYTMEAWAEKCWQESRRGFTTYAVLPFAPQTEWYRRYVYGHTMTDAGARIGWNGHAALEERRLPHRISFLRPDGTAAENAGVNSAIIKWGPATGRVGPWSPASFYWTYR